MDNPDNAYAEDDWMKEYSEICAKTQTAMALSIKALQTLDDRC